MERDSYAEISEKRTSKLGYLLLVALFVFMIIIGQTVFRDISRIPERPEGPGYCVNAYLSEMVYVNYKPPCRFSDIDREFGIEALVGDLEPELDAIIGYNQEISSKQNALSFGEREMDELLRSYDISLQEVIAGEEDVLMDKPEIKEQVLSLRAANENLREGIDGLTAKRDALVQAIAPKVAELKDAHERAQEEYRNRLAYYNLKVFLLKLAFVLPFFLISLYYYLRYKKRDSPYAIIATSVLYASTILFLQIVLTFLYRVLPREWLTRIFEILKSVPMLRYVVYYGVTVLVIVILGGIVYFIQKRIYDPERVALRHLKEGKCPGCSLTLDLAGKFCPNCARKLSAKCPECGNLRFVDLTYCPHCGKR